MNGMFGKTQTSLRQSREFQTRMKSGWLGCYGQWCQKRQTDQGYNITTRDITAEHYSIIANLSQSTGGKDSFSWNYLPLFSNCLEFQHSRHFNIADIDM